MQPEPRLLVLPAAAVSLDEAHAAIDLWEFYSGKRLDPTQRLVVEIMMATDGEDRWAAKTTGREMPRQQGKGDEIEVPEFWGLVKLHEAIMHTVQEAVLLTTMAQERMLSLFQHRDLRPLIEGPGSKVWKGVGQQMVQLTTGGVIWYRTRSSAGGGRGADKIDRLVVDEAQHATVEQLANYTSTLMQSPDPQSNLMGTAALEGKSAWWWSIRKRALSAEPGAFGYVGHTAESPVMDDHGRVHVDPVDPSDRSLWLPCNPASFNGRPAGREQAMAYLEEEFRTLGPGRFAEEHLCVWAPESGSTAEHPIHPDIWSGLLTPGSTPTDHLQWALAVSEDRRWASIGLAGRNSERKLHVEWMHHRAGTAWIVDVVAEAWEKRRIPIRIHKAGSEAALIAPLRAVGVEVVEVSSADVAQATGQMIDAANAGDLVHLGQPSLTKALMAAEVRTSIDGASVWSERKSSTEITPLKAVTVALGGVPAQVPVFSGNPFTNLDDWEDD